MRLSIFILFAVCACSSSTSSTFSDAAASDALVLDAGAGDAGMDSALDASDSALVDAGVDTGPLGGSDAAAWMDGADDGSSVVEDAALDAGGPWRSVLYPDDWTAAFGASETTYLHDFSYAGYHNGETAIGAYGPTSIINVVTAFGADPTGGRDTTADVQAAIDSVASSGGVIYFPAGLYRFDGTLAITHSNIVLRGVGPEESRLYFSKFAGMRGRGHIEFLGRLTRTREVPLAVDGISRAAFIEVADASDLAVGDEVSVGWVITPEFIADHGMTGIWTAFNGQWRSFFRRSIVAVDRSTSPQRILLDVPLRYPARTRDLASVRRETGYLREVGIESLGISNVVAGRDAWSEVLVSAILFSSVEDAWMRDVHSFASPLTPTSGGYAGYHLQSRGITIEDSKRVTVADSRLEYAENRGGGGSGYLFEMLESNEVLFRDDVGHKGRHNFIQNYGFGNTGCVWLRVHSYEGQCDLNFDFGDIGIGGVCSSEFHHSLATANLIDSSTFDDGMKVLNRGTESTGAGITGTENVFWNTRGSGTLVSMQYRQGYVIGTQDIRVQLNGTLATYPMAYTGTAPDDYAEGLGRALTLEPQSLYEDQLARRLASH